MKVIIKHLWPLVVLIFLASSVLLLSDPHHRKHPRRARATSPHPVAAEPVKQATVAIAYYGESEANTLFLKGINAGFKQAGYREGDNLTVHRGHGSSEPALLPQVTQSLLAHQPDALIAASTPNLTAAIQTADPTLPIVFGFAAAPLEAGGGRSFSDHRPNVTGAVFTIPTRDLVNSIKTTFPQARTVGMLYNPAEANAVKEISILKNLFEPLGIRLITGTVHTPADVPQALQAILPQQPDFLYLITENTVYNCRQSIIRTSTEARIPCVVDDDSMMGTGALLSQGPDPYTEGIRTARMTARILDGENPADMPFAPSTDHPLTFDLGSAKKLNLALTSELRQQIKKVYRFRDFHGRPAKIMISMYNDSQFAEESLIGLQAGLKQAGLIEGTDFTLRVLNAQGDMSTLTASMSSINAEKPDLLFVISTPCLQAALRLVDKNTPIVFTAVADGVKAGAGSSESQHLPNVTGITTSSPFQEMTELIRQGMPDAKKVGTLFTPAEVNSVLYCDRFEQALNAQGMELIRVPVTATADTPQATDTLCSRDIDLIVQVSDNTIAPGIGQVIHKAEAKGIPTFVFVSAQMKSGATACMACDYYDAAIESARKALRILLGESPAAIPFSNTRAQQRIINPEKARQFELHFQ